MSIKNTYFSRAPIMGVGKLHFLIVPREAPADSGDRALLGSLVAEYDTGLLGGKEVPGPDHVWKRRYLLEMISRAQGTGGQTWVESQDLAGVTQSVKVEKKFGFDLGLSFPGVPASGKIGIDYSKLRTVELVLGAGCRKEYIPVGFLKAGFDFARHHSDEFDRQLFDDDYMACQQILIVKEMAISVVSEIDFSAGFEAKAEEINGLGIGVTYSKKSKKEYTVKLNDGKEYLFGIGAVQLERL
jgi:hypothetical protein